jgi:hypothetical protein
MGGQPDRAHLGPHLNLLLRLSSQEALCVPPTNPNPEITFISTPSPQVRQRLPLESSPTCCSLWDLSLQLVHSYS